MSGELQIVGWREWVALPQLGIERIKCKVDTGARSSALHAYFVEPFTKENAPWVRFGIHPLQRNSDLVHICEAAVVDQRFVTDSGGHKEKRFVIVTQLQIGATSRNIEITLTDRESMQFRMLLGRTALKGLFAVNPAVSYVIGRKKKSKKREKK